MGGGPAALFAASLAALFAAGLAAAGEWDVSGSVGLETRVFVHKPARAGQDDAGRLQASVFAQPEIVYEWNDGADRLTLEPFVRLDEEDARRTHGDLRIASYLHAAGDWDLIVGLHRVFWGVAESRHLVDIVNQTDGVEDIDAEDKLGQPMINLNLDRDWGRVSAFLMIGFRERSFARAGARLGGGAPIDIDRPSFESDARRAHPDLALRWFHTLGDWDVGLAHFRGTSRAPRLIPVADPGTGLSLVPRYDLIDQSSVDAQFTAGAWLLKFESLFRTGHGDPFVAATGGFEYTLYQILGGRADLGLLAEYHYDGRDPAAAPPTLFDNDVFAGARLTLNDEADTALLMGAIVDHRDGSTLFQAEAGRRVFESWKIEIEARIFLDIDAGSPIAGIRNDDFVTVRATRFF